jgi:hypothetical protein
LRRQFRSLKGTLSSKARTLRAWVPIPLGAICLCCTCICVFLCRPISRPMSPTKFSWFQKLILNWNGPKSTEADKSRNKTKGTNYSDPHYVTILYCHLRNTKIFLRELCSPTSSICVRHLSER